MRRTVPWNGGFWKNATAGGGSWIREVWLIAGCPMSDTVILATYVRMVADTRESNTKPNGYDPDLTANA